MDETDVWACSRSLLGNRRTKLGARDATLRVAINDVQYAALTVRWRIETTNVCWRVITTLRDFNGLFSTVRTTQDLHGANERNHCQVSTAAQQKLRRQQHQQCFRRKEDENFSDAEFSGFALCDDVGTDSATASTKINRDHY